MLGVASVPAAHALKAFNSPEAAMTAFGNAVAENDDAALKAMLGSDFREVIPPIGANIRYLFLSGWAKSHAIQPAGDGRAHITVGHDGWTLPIPIVKSAQGWQFDMRAGAEEIRIRRIGRNEHNAMQAVLALCDAQREYAAQDHDADGLLEYAARLASSTGKHDGLYWPKMGPEKESPLGAAYTAASGLNMGPQGYHGYHYKLLTSQGAHAPGGALDYVAKSNLFGGFAVMAWPARYGDSGVMSFIARHDGLIYQRDLGPDSAAKAAATKSFDPGPGWTKVTP